MKLNKFIDHTLLNNTAKRKSFNTLIDQAIDYGFFSVCVPPHVARYAHKTLKGSPVKTCSVAGFPLGYNNLKAKKNEIENLYSIGCDEVDVVLNINNVKDKNWSGVEKEFKVFSKISNSNCLKVIIESGVLTDKEIESICSIATAHPVSFLKTSTGFAEKSASLSAVRIMKKNIPSSIEIKASGGIRNQEQALAYIEAGATRLGCSASINIVKG